MKRKLKGGPFESQPGIPSPVDFSTKSLALPELFPPVYTFYSYYFYVLF